MPLPRCNPACLVSEHAPGLNHVIAGTCFGLHSSKMTENSSSVAQQCSSVHLQTFLTSPCIFRLWGRPRVLYWPPEPHYQRAPEPQPRLCPRWRAAQRPASEHRGTHRRPSSQLLLQHAGKRGWRQPLDRRGRRRSEGPASETGLQLCHVPQLPAALCLHDRHQGFLPVTDQRPPLCLLPEQKMIDNGDNNNE